MPQKVIAAASEHSREMKACVVVDGERVHVHAALFGFEYGVSYVGDAVTAFVPVVVVRLAVGENQQQAPARVGSTEQLGRVSQRRADSRVSTWFEACESMPRALPRLRERLHDLEPTIEAGVAVKGGDRELDVGRGEVVSR